MSLLNDELKKLPTDKLEKFSEVDVQITLSSAIKAAARKDSPEMHSILAKLVLDRVQKPNHSIAELAIDESIESISKLDTNLIKILALVFILSRTKYTNIMTVICFLNDYPML